MKITFFSKAKARQFDYKPRYYDAKKEAEEKRKKEIENNIKNPERLSLRSEMRSKWGRHDNIRSKSKTYSIAVYIVLVVLIIYLIFF